MYVHVHKCLVAQTLDLRTVTRSTYRGLHLICVFVCQIIANVFACGATTYVATFNHTAL